MSKNATKKVLAIPGSTRQNSSNLQLIGAIANLSSGLFEVEIYHHLSQLPHFNPDLDITPLPELVAELRTRIAAADGILICTPEYVFSLPGSLKNGIEWTVSTTIFSDKPVALITASGLGEKTHDSLGLIMKTVGAVFTERTHILIQGARTKVNDKGEILDEPTLYKIKDLIAAFDESLHKG